MTLHSIISDPAFGNFLVMLIFFGWMKWQERKNSADGTAEQDKNKYITLIISNSEVKRKVGR